MKKEYFNEYNELDYIYMQPAEFINKEGHIIDNIYNKYDIPKDIEARRYNLSHTDYKILKRFDKKLMIKLIIIL